MGYKWEPTAALGEHQAPQKTIHFLVVEAIWGKTNALFASEESDHLPHTDTLLSQHIPHKKPADKHL